DAMVLVRRLAFVPEERPIRSAESIEAWLGPRAGWTERTKASPLFHEVVQQHTRVFRLVKTPSLRANFSELVAVDTRGAPFVTSVVGSIEIRRGESADSAACLALTSPARLRVRRTDRRARRRRAPAVAFHEPRRARLLEVQRLPRQRHERRPPVGD